MRKSFRKPLAVLLSLVMLLSSLSAGLIVPASATDITGNADAYSVAYDPNGGTGEMAAQAMYNRQAVQTTANAFTRTGYRYTGWNTAANGSGVSYADGATVTNPAVSYRARYIRIYAAGSTSNSSNHLIELQAIDTQGRNVALNKTGDRVTDGGFGEEAWLGYDGYYQIDLGARYDIKTVNMWRYWVDKRTYYNTVVVLSDNGSFAVGDRLVLFNADYTNRFGFGIGIDMKYPESNKGISMNVSDVLRANTYEARYLRVYAAGSNQNYYNHYTEIAVYDNQGNNVALGKTGDVVTDGTVASNPYYNMPLGNGEPFYYQIDLGSLYDITSIGLWRYWADSRTYYDTVVVLSKNGTFAEGDRFVVFNADDGNRFGFGCGADKDYVETERGKAIYVENEAKTLPTFDARYMRIYANGNSANSSNHLVEVQAFANGTNVALGKSGTVATDGVVDTNNGWMGFSGYYYQIDFGAVYPVNSVRYWNYWADGRFYYNLVVVLSKNGTFAGDDLCVLWNNDNTNMFGFGAGTDPRFTETSAGKTFWVSESPAGLTTSAKARYVRVYNGGSYANDASGDAYQSHISEIQVFAGGVNVASGKTGNVATDGSRADLYPAYVGYGWGPGGAVNYYQVDLGAVYDVTGVKLWQYYSDNRTYHNNVIVLSENGTFAGNDYTVIFNTDYCNMHGFGKGYDNEYVESMAGRLFPVRNVYAASSGTKTLYAQWIPNNYTINFDKNGTGVEGSTASVAATYDASVALTANGFSRFGYTFSGWAESADGAVVYGDGATVENLTAEHNGVVTLYAVWTADPYTMTFDVNGGDAIAPVGYTVESEDVIPTPNRDGYDFTGWTATAAAGSWTVGQAYAVGTPLGGKIGDVTLKASWSVRYDTPYTVNHYYMTADGTYPVSAVSQTLMGETDTAAYSAALVMATEHYTFDAAASDASVTILGDGSAVLNLYYVLDQYTVTFNVDGTETSEDYYYGAVPAYGGETPTLAGTDQYTYTFLGWTADAGAEPGAQVTFYTALPAVTGEATYYPYFGTEVNSYDITFSVDGVDTTVSFPYGATPAYDGIPAKEADAQYTYTFTGWDSEIVPVAGEATYTAVFEATVRQYPVFVNGGVGSAISLSSGMRDWGTVLEFTVTVDEAYSASEPVVTVGGEALDTPEGNGGVYSYSVTVTGNTEISVSDLAKNTYTVTFIVDGTGTEATVAYGDTPAYNGIPAKDATAQYTYNFTGWEPAIVPATADAEYTAQFDPAVRYYTVTFVVEGTETPIDYAYGATPAFGFVPAKAADETNTYAFAGWSVSDGGEVAALAEVTGDATYYAIFTATPIPAHEHDFATFVRTVAPTCAAGGYDEYICECGMTEQRNPTAVNAANHALAAITVGAREATETEDGYSGDLICPACGRTITEGSVIPKTGAETPAPHEHEFSFVRTVAATCCEKGYDEYACACGMTEKRNETARVNKNNHVGTVLTVGKRAATETADGYTGDKVCSACGKTLTTGSVIPKTGSEAPAPHTHTFDTFVDHHDATCCEKGYDEYKCECGMTEKRNETASADANNHAGVILTVGKRAATETADGYTGDKVCSACGKTVKRGSVIPKTGTEPTDPTEPTEPEEPTVYEHGCPICGETHDGNIIQKLIGLVHTFLYMIRTMFKTVPKS